MLFYTTHILNYISLDRLIDPRLTKTTRCPFCRGRLNACDCGYGQMRQHIGRHQVTQPKHKWG